MQMSIFKRNKNELCSPCDGEIIPLEEIDDEVFSSGLLGYGYGVIPTQGEFFSPIEGKVTNVYDTGHAYTIVGKNGLEILVHIGIDTVELEGDFFTPRVKEGDKVKRGSMLAYADLEKIREEGYDTTTAIIISSEIKNPTLKTGVAKAKDLVLTYDLP